MSCLFLCPHLGRGWYYSTPTGSANDNVYLTTGRQHNYWSARRKGSFSTLYSIRICMYGQTHTCVCLCTIRTYKVVGIGRKNKRIIEERKRKIVHFIVEKYPSFGIQHFAPKLQVHLQWTYIFANVWRLGLFANIKVDSLCWCRTRPCPLHPGQTHV